MAKDTRMGFPQGGSGGSGGGGGARRVKPKLTVTTPKKPMTKTVIQKVSPDVKIIKPGSKPRTQSATEKRAIVEKAKTKTPAAREKVRSAKKYSERETTRIMSERRRYITNNVYRDALRDAGYKSPGPGKGFGEGPTPAQIKAANKAVAQAERDIKAAILRNSSKK